MPTPLEYVLGNVQLHLDTPLPPTHPAVTSFLSSPQDVVPDASSRSALLTRSSSIDEPHPLLIIPPRLFVYISLPSNEVKSSCETFETPHDGCVCFINSSASVSSSANDSSAQLSVATISTFRQINVMTIPASSSSPFSDASLSSSTPQDDATPQAQAQAQAQPNDVLFSSMQLYTQHCFIPAVKSITTSASVLSTTSTSTPDPSKPQPLSILSKKLQEFDLVINQCRKSTNIFTPLLTPHPTIASILSKNYLSPSSPPPSKLDLDELGITTLLLDDKFLNSLQLTVNNWIREIQKLSSQINAPFPNDALEEIMFWKSLQSALSSTNNSLSSANVQLTITTLKQAKRFATTIALENNTSIAPAISHATDVNSFLNDLPLSTLTTALDLPTVLRSIANLFEHFPKIRNSKNYDLERLARLLESITVLLKNQLIKILNEKKLMKLEFNSFVLVSTEFDAIFSTFDSEYKKFTTFFIEQHKRRGSLYNSNSRFNDDSNNSQQFTNPLQLLKSLIFAHLPLQSRLAEITSFRNDHQNLQTVVKSVLSSSSDDDEIINNLEEAALKFSNIAILDLSVDGGANFITTHDSYNRRIDKVENKLIQLLHSKLNASSNADDMFKVFSKFNPLFFRTRVRNAIKQYQMELIKNVNAAIETIQVKFTQKYEESEAQTLAVIRDIPPVAGKIMWAKLMERQINQLTQRMENVLGKGWEQQMEGRLLKKVCNELLAKLDTQHFFRGWIKQWEQELSLSRGKERLSSYLITIEGNNKRLTAVCNFDTKTINLFKEVRNLHWLGFDVPPTIQRMSDEALSKYPNAVTLRSALRSYAKTRILIDNAENLTLLVEPQLNAVKISMHEAFNPTNSAPTLTKKSKHRVKWDSVNVSEWVSTFSELVFTFQEKVELLLETIERINDQIFILDETPFTHSSFIPVVELLQKHVDTLSLAGFSNLSAWVKTLDARIEEKLSIRLSNALEAWKGDSIDPIPIEVLLQDQVIFASPSIETTRMIYVRQFSTYLDTVAKLPRLSSSRFDVLASVSTSTSTSILHDRTFSSIILNLYHNPATSSFLTAAYQTINSHISAAQIYVTKWLDYQSLWDMSMDNITSLIGEDIKKWQQLLLEAREARSTLDNNSNTTPQQSFGPVIVNYGKVQNKVDLKYDAWEKELQHTFGAMLLTAITASLAIFVESKQKLEAVVLEGSTQDIIRGVTYIQEMKQKHKIWGKEVVLLEESELLLKKQRFAFPSSTWVQASNVLGAFSDFEQILARRQKSMNDQIPALQNRVRSEDKQTTKRVADLVASWEKQKPLRGNVNPTDAMDALASFAIVLKKNMEDFDLLAQAKDALDLEASGDSMLLPLHEEMIDLKEVWSAMRPIHTSLEELHDSLWNNIVPRKNRKQLDVMLEDLRQLPNRVRQYDVYTHVYETIKSYVSNHSLLIDLKTEALKPRHWKLILQRLALRLTMSELTLGHLYEAGILNRKKDIAEILSIAQGEMALEEFLRQVRDYWQACDLELVLYQNRVRLIKGWDLIFAKLEEHMNSLAQMKQSPYFKSVQEFQEEAVVWEDRLTRLREIFDHWIDVQRRWVYLESIFFGSADIKAQLPAEYSRFKSVDNEFVSLMRKISQKPNAMEVFQIENLSRQLERMELLMTKVQKALGTYLSAQREAFSRFYFVGDEDLLEIIGNSGEPVKVMSHLGKMFASISQMRWSETPAEGDMITLTHMSSKDGESVPLEVAIHVKDKMSVKEWLRQIESNMQGTLAALLQSAVNKQSSSDLETEDQKNSYVTWASEFPAQIMILASLISWSMEIDIRLTKDSSLGNMTSSLNGKLQLMAQMVLTDLAPEIRKKFEQLITELVHQRDVARELEGCNVTDVSDFKWLYHLRFNYNPDATNLLQKLNICMSNASFYYGFEYLGIGERLVQTPLTDRCYLTLTQALHFRMGGNPFGPAGTGKTESVKALGAQLGRFVLVFNCDEAFDFGAMGRIFAGLCQVGAWGCFDEFNRLEERILSAVSQQILTIQRGLIMHSKSIELLGRSVNLHGNIGIFVTMNPGYAGRSNLPDNLKQLFRAVAMVIPDRKLIAQVMLFSQGIVSAEELSGKIVLLFQLCEEQLSNQSHYDFGLRALKTLLVSAGGLKRAALNTEDDQLKDSAMSALEKTVLIQGACNNIVPKLVAEDLPLFASLLEAVFPAAKVFGMEDGVLRVALKRVCAQHFLVEDSAWIEKILQLKQVLSFRHGVMMVGPSGSGKSTTWRCLLEAMETVDGVKGEAHVIDPKAISKETLYGSLDATTMEWTDGIFTSILRAVINNQRGESTRRHWILFDGDVDPEWAENLNSVLDDNKLLTLPSGERLSVPDNVRILLEVDSLKEATPATVSRCGMVWFSEDTVSSEMCMQHLVNKLSGVTATASGGNNVDGSNNVPVAEEKKDGAASTITTRTNFVKSITSFFVQTADSPPSSQPVVPDMLEYSLNQTHIMHPTRGRLLTSLEGLLQRGIDMAIDYDENHIDFPMSEEHMSKFAMRWLLHSLVWGFVGSCPWVERKAFGEQLFLSCGIALPDSNSSDNSDGDGEGLAAFRVRIEDGEWEAWSSSVPKIEIESHMVTSIDVVITTTDTVRHVDVLSSWISSRKPLILCGPPGSGKTMTLTSTLQALPDIVLAPLNFSSGTTPRLILKTFHQYCEYIRTPKGIVLQPVQSVGAGKWLVVFCDEINLPQKDNYGTQRVISFMRQLTEQGGFWRDDCVWIKLNRIQFVGACNPPTDAGRVTLSSRFMRHAPLLLVDFPARDSLIQIYRTFNGGIMKLFPNLKGEVDALTEAMVDLYSENQRHFTVDIMPQYFYSPRELSRWVRAIYEAVQNADSLSRDELVRLWAHEALRLFNDRLVTDEDQEWAEDKIDEVARKHFVGISASCLQRPIMYSTWLNKQYMSVDREQLRAFMSARLKVFYEEELDVPLVVFDEVLEHVLRIDRVLKQPMGHCLLVGDSGAGKTVLSKFVSWMNGLSIFQIKAHSKYSLDDFNEDLRVVLKRVGVNGERISFIFDESNALSSSFLEAMNALLASGEVPGLFEGDELLALMASCRENALKEGLVIDGDEELWSRFVKSVQRNLHVIFTMNPSGDDFSNRSTTSPALFNRCVVDWFGTWGITALGQVGKEFTNSVDLGEENNWVPPNHNISIVHLVDAVFRTEGMEEEDVNPTLRQAVVAALVDMHQRTKVVCENNNRSALCKTYLSPRDFLDLISNFVKIVLEKRGNLEEQQLHINIGLEKLGSTQEQVRKLEESLGVKKRELSEKEELANNKLQQMISDQNIAEIQKKEALKLNIEVARQQEYITIRQQEAQSELDSAEPALISAQQSVRSIKKSHLDEIRALARPPDNVRMTLEAIAIMLGRKQLDWTDIRKMLNTNDFIPSILEFDVDKLTNKQIKIVRENYLMLDTLTVESVTRSSKACGPLFKWVESQICYSEIFNKVIPLRDEVERLQEDAKEVVGKKSKLDVQVEELESRIAQYKADYAELIRSVEMIKSEMGGVKTKVSRAGALITSLAMESERWSTSSGNFASQLSTVVGDGLLSAAFLTYAGFFDHSYRQTLLLQWKDSLTNTNVTYRSNFCSVIEYLSKASDRLTWNSMGLPSDNLCLENAIILERFNRFPLVIDPSGQATSFLMNKYAERKISKTSFLDQGFMKTLASAIRFGTILLVSDVEKIDPILNPILNKELQKTGGRTLIRLGSEDIDYSPKFMLILTTRNVAAKLTPDLCSRVTLVNFTVTPESLGDQALRMLLRSERPEIEGKRSGLLKVQGEQNVVLRGLEEKLLEMISSVQGSILDDDSVILGMEQIKIEASAVSEQIKEGEVVMKEVQSAIGMYKGFADVISKVFFVIDKLKSVNHLYQYSLNFFMDVLEAVFENNKSGGGGAGTGSSSVAAHKERLELLKGKLFAEVVARVARGLFSEDKLVFALRLAILAESEDKASTSSTTFDLKAASLTPETLISLGESHVLKTFGASFNWQGRGLNHLRLVCSTEISASAPILLCSAPGYDVSGRVEVLASECDRDSSEDGHLCKLQSLAMGSSEGYLQADKLLAQCSKDGTWLMLKNIHLCHDEWLNTLEKKLHSMTYTSTFRLFLTCEMNEYAVALPIPITLVIKSDVTVAEVPIGLKANIYRFFTSIPESRFLQPPVERSKLYLLVAWVHAVIQERLRYVPSGWSKRYEFCEKDGMNALDVVDAWVDKVAEGNGTGTGTGGRKVKKHVDPVLLPWEALRTILAESVFGGRIDNVYDQAVLTSFINNVFTPDAYNVDFTLVSPSSSEAEAESSVELTLPEGNTRVEFMKWIDELPGQSNPMWLGLPKTAEKARLKFGGVRVFGKMVRIGGADGADDAGEGSSDNGDGKSDDGGSGVKDKLSTILQTCKKWLAGLPQFPSTTNTLDDTDTSTMTSLHLCISREITLGKTHLSTLTTDITQLVIYCKGRGEVKLTNHVKHLLDSVSVGVIPDGWRGFYEGCLNVVEGWFCDFVNRIEQLIQFHSVITATTKGKEDKLENQVFNIGLLFNPGSFVTASRQFVARKFGLSIEDLKFVFQVGHSLTSSEGGVDDGFNVCGLCIEGAGIVSGGRGCIGASDETSEDIEACYLRWVSTDTDTKSNAKSSANANTITLPIYQNNANRKRVIVAIEVECPEAVEKEVWMQRGVAFFFTR